MAKPKMSLQKSCLILTVAIKIVIALLIAWTIFIVYVNITENFATSNTTVSKTVSATVSAIGKVYAIPPINSQTASDQSDVIQVVPGQVVSSPYVVQIDPNQTNSTPAQTNSAAGSTSSSANETESTPDFSYLNALSRSSDLTVYIVISLTLGLLGNGLIVAALCVVHSIFKKIRKSDTPFIPGISFRMKITALLVAVCAVLPYINVGLQELIVRYSTSLAISYTISINGIFLLLIAGVCFCFSIIFDYGYRLQKQDDETL